LANLRSKLADPILKKTKDNVCLNDAKILSENNEVLRRPRFEFEEEKVAALLDYIMYRGWAVASSPLQHSLPDPDDEPFLEVALASKTVCFITGNLKHFPTNRCQDAKILSLNDFLFFFKNQEAGKKQPQKRSILARKNRAQVSSLIIRTNGISPNH